MEPISSLPLRCSRAAANSGSLRAGVPRAHLSRHAAGRRPLLRRRRTLRHLHRPRQDLAAGERAKEGVEVLIGSKDQCLFCFETCTIEGRGGEKGGSANSRTKHTEPLTQGLISPLNMASCSLPVTKGLEILRNQ